MDIWGRGGKFKIRRTEKSHEVWSSSRLLWRVSMGPDFPMSVSQVSFSGLKGLEEDNVPLFWSTSGQDKIPQVTIRCPFTPL